MLPAAPPLMVARPGVHPWQWSHFHLPAGSDEILPADQLADLNGYPVENPKARRSAAVDYDSIISLWADQTVPPSSRARDNKTSKMRRMFGWLIANRGFPQGCTDMARVSADDLQAYKESLPATVRRDHLIDIKALFNTAAKARRLPNGNPATEVETPAKVVNPRTARQIFTAEERRLILTEARKAEPVVRWANWIACFSGAITEEIAEADSRDIEIINGGSGFAYPLRSSAGRAEPQDGVPAASGAPT